MKTTFACVLLFLCLAVAALAAPPKVSEEFSSIIRVTLADKTGSTPNITGHGFWASSLKGGKTIQRFQFGQHHPLNELHLQRFDLLAAYDEASGDACVELPLEGPMSPVWDWVSLATESTKYVGHEKFSAWTFTMGYATVSLYFQSDSTPRWFIVDGDYRTVSIEFLHWIAETPAASMFNVPKDCSHTNQTADPSVGCHARSTIMARAQDWVNHHVPYSQTGRYAGYRTDCSGYVSMAWQTSQPGYVTSTLPQISHPIARGALQPGDVLLCRSEHVVIFGGWSGPSHYIAYEETRPGEGTVRRVTPYPYWYNTGCFLPYRYNSVC